jgi:hypothetical protein
MRAETPSKRLRAARGVVLTYASWGLSRRLGASYSEGLYDYSGDADWLAPAADYDPLTEQHYVALVDDFAARVPSRSVIEVGHFIEAATNRAWRARDRAVASGRHLPPGPQPSGHPDGSVFT